MPKAFSKIMYLGRDKKACWYIQNCNYKI